jgi:hypothetical protein
LAIVAGKQCRASSARKPGGTLAAHCARLPADRGAEIIEIGPPEGDFQAPMTETARRHWLRHETSPGDGKS